MNAQQFEKELAVKQYPIIRTVSEKKLYLHNPKSGVDIRRLTTCGDIIPPDFLFVDL